MARSKTALLFSGGKDSVACLHLLRDQLEFVDVVWVRAGEVTEEQDAFMSEVREAVPNFVELRGDSGNWIASNGWPVAVVPVLHTNLGTAMGEVGTRYAPFTSCCNDNKFDPIERYVTGSGVTRVITGQKRCDAVRNKAQEDNPWFEHPLADWTDADVFGYIAEHGLTFIAAHDCAHCTAYGQPETEGAKVALAELKEILSASVEQLDRLGV